MHVERALAHIHEIHAQVLRSEIFRGYRAVPVAVTGALALAVAFVQSAWLPPLPLRGHLLLWVGYAVACGVVCGTDLGLRCAFGDHWLRQQAVLAVRQFAPAMVVGLALTAALLDSTSAALLPGLWTLVFALGVFASLPYLPREILWVALFYLAAGVMLLASASPAPPSPWTLGSVFGLGQLACAWLLRTRLGA
jgi:hypothetical protein